MDKTLAAAQIIATARRNRTPLAALPPDLVPSDEAEGYQIQRAVHDLLLPQTGSLVGYKIGCTSAVMQQYLDIPHPCGGGVFAKGVHGSGARWHDPHGCGDAVEEFPDDPSQLHRPLIQRIVSESPGRCRSQRHNQHNAEHMRPWQGNSRERSS